MTLQKIRAALEVHLASLLPAIDSAYENQAFTPVTGTPYQDVRLLLATPDSPMQGVGARKLGYMQVTLRYQLGIGTAIISERAMAIYNKFPKGLELTNDDVKVTIISPVSIGSGYRDDDRWAVPVRIYWQSNFFY